MTKTLKRFDIRDIRFINRNWSWLLSGLIVMMFFIIFMIFNGIAPFGSSDFTYADSYLQYVPFLHELKYKMVTGDSWFYTWDMSFGQDFYGVIVYYLASPFNLFLYFVSEDSMLGFFSFLIVTKISLSACTFGYYLSRREDDDVKNNMFILTTSMLYALCGWSCVMFWNIMWLDGFMILPLVILGLERLIYKKDFRLYVVTLFYAMCTNFYIGLIISVFLFMYFLMLRHKDIDKFAFNFIRFLGYSVLSVIMSAIVLIPVYYLTGKVSGGLVSAASITTKGFLPFRVLISNLFFNVSSNLFSYSGIAGLPSVYCGLIFLPVFFIYLLSPTTDVWMKVKRVFIFLFLFASIDIRILSFIFDGMHSANGMYSRFAFVVIFLAIVMIYDVLSNIQFISYKKILLAVFLSLTLYIGMTVIMCNTENLVNFGYVGGFITIIVSIALLCTYGGLLCIRQMDEKYRRCFCNTVLCVFVILELLVNAWWSLELAQIAVLDENANKNHVALTKEDTGFDVELDDSSVFYRIAADKIVADGLDFDTWFHVKNIDSFDSMMSMNTAKMMLDAGLFADKNVVRCNGSNLLSNDMLGIRYIFVKNENGYFNKDIYKGYEEVARNNLYTIYENKNALSIAYCLPDDMLNYESDLMPSNSVYNHISNSLNIDNVLLSMGDIADVKLLTSNDCLSYDKVNHKIICDDDSLLSKDDKVIIDFDVTEDGYYYFDSDNLALCNITAYVNDNIVFKGDIHENGYVGQFIDLGERKVGDKVKIEVEMLIITFDKKDIYLDDDLSFDVFKVNELALDKFRNKLSENQMNVTSMQSNILEGSIKVPDGDVIYTSIPYDKGWDVYIDGAKLSDDNIIELSNGALCIKATPGEHQIYMEFVPQGFYLGLMVSCCGILLYVILFVIKTRRLKQKKVE